MPENNMQSWMDRLPPIPPEPMPDNIVPFHGLDLFLRVGIGVVDGISHWVRKSWGEGVCDVYRCLEGADEDKVPTLPYGGYHFCGQHYVVVMNRIAAEAARLNPSPCCDVNGVPLP